MSAQDARIRRLSPKLVRAMALVAAVVGIVGMILASIDDNDQVAITFGLLCAMAGLQLVVLSAVVPPGKPDREATAAELEARIAALVADGADERELRAAVRVAVDLGRCEA